MKTSTAQFVSVIQSEPVMKNLSEILPKGTDVAQFIRICLTVIKQSPALQSCDPYSILSAIVKAAELKLQPSALSGQAYLVPYGRQCQLIIGYKGLMTLARRSPRILSIDAKAVYEGDAFDYEFGSKPYLRHKHVEGYIQKPIAHFYAIAYLKGQLTQFEVMSVEEVNFYRDRFSKGSKREDSPWASNYVAMGKKTVLRRLCGLLPMEDRVQECLIEEEMAEQGKAVSSPIQTPAVEASNQTDLLENILNQEQTTPRENAVHE